jgi:hypothetical protein
MKTIVLMVSMLVILGGCGGDSVTDFAQGVQLKREFISTQRLSNVLMTSHRGNVLHSNKTAAIFWGSQWTTASFAGDKIVGMESFFSGFNQSRYASTGNEYYDASGHVTASSTHLGYVIDTTSTPTQALSASSATNEVCKITANNPDPSTVYFIYTSTSAGNVNYCAWHTWGNCSNGKQLQVAYVPNISNIAGCDPPDTSSGHSQGLSAMANVTAHELMETITDPRGNSWYDYAGNEIGDKCAWSFPPVLSKLSNGSVWKLQMEWSNAAYSNSTGLPNAAGQKGCIY